VLGAKEHTWDRQSVKEAFMEASAKKYIYLHSAVVQRPMPQWANVFFASDWLGTKLGLCNLQTDSASKTFRLQTYRETTQNGQ
jgi:hypothetical protein